MWTAFPSSDYYEGSAPRSALAASWPTPLPESGTWFPSSRELRRRVAVGSACTPGAVRGRARRQGTTGCTECGVPVLKDCPCMIETGVPMAPPSPYRERVVIPATLQTAVSFVTVATLWLAARGLVGWPPPHCREGFRHGSASGPRACLRSHRPTPGRVPSVELSTHALLGAPMMWNSAAGAIPGLSFSCLR